MWEVLNSDVDDDPSTDRIGGVLDALAERSIAKHADHEAEEADAKRRAQARQQAQEILAAQEARQADERAAEKARQHDQLTAELLKRSQVA